MYRNDKILEIETTPGAISQSIFVIFYCALLLVSVVIVSRWLHGDSIHGGNAFWMSRPARARHLLGAKLFNVFALFFVLSTLLEYLFATRIASGWGSLWAIPNTLWMCFLHMAPLLFIASITSRLDKALLVAALFAIALGVSLVFGFGILRVFLRAELAPNWQVAMVAIWSVGFFVAFVLKILRGSRRQAVWVALGFVFSASWIALFRMEVPERTRLERLETAREFAVESVEGGFFTVPGSEIQRETFFIEQSIRPRDNLSDRFLSPFKVLTRYPDLYGNAKWVEGNLGFDVGNLPYARLLRAAGYPLAREAAENERAIRARVAKLALDGSTRLPKEGSTIELVGYFSEYHVRAINELSIAEGARLTDSSIVTSIVRVLSEPPLLSKGSVLRIRVKEEAVWEKFHPSIYTGSDELAIGETSRFYYLYDRESQVFLDTNQIVQSVRDVRSETYVNLAGFASPAMSLGVKELEFLYAPTRDVPFDFSRYDLVALDLQKVAERKAVCQSSGDRLTAFMKGLLEDREEQTRVNERTPHLVLNGDDSKKDLLISAAPGSSVILSAQGSIDPEGERISYFWAIKRIGPVRAEAILTERSGISTTLALSSTAPVGARVQVDLTAKYDGFENRRVRKSAIISVGREGQ